MDTTEPTDSSVVDESKPSSSAALRSVLVFWGSVALIEFVVFCCLRNTKRFKKIYNVRDCVDKLRCELAARSLDIKKWNILAWIPAVLRATDDEIFAQVGLDGLCYIRSVAMGMKLSMLGCFIAVWSIPVYFTSPTVLSIERDGYVQEVPRSNANVTDIMDRMSMGHTYHGDPRMFAGVVAAYMISFYGMWLLNKEYNWFIVQRHRYLQRRAPQNYSIFIHCIPKSLRSKAALREYFGVFFNDILEIHLMKRIPKLEKLCEKRDKLEGQIKHSEALLQKMRAAKSLVLLPVALFQNHTAQEEALASRIREDKDSLVETKAQIESRVKELEEEWKAHEEAVARGDEAALAGPPGSLLDAAFITFKTLKAATCARQLSHHQLPFRLVAEEAPVPGHVVWSNCGLNRYRKEAFQLLAGGLTCAVCVFWVFPITFVASLQKVEELKKLGPEGCHAAGNCPIKVVSDAFPLLDEVLAILAPWFLIWLSYWLPVILWYVVALEGHIGMDTFHASLFSKLTLFMIVQTFFVSAMAGALFSELNTFVNNPLGQAQHILASSLPAQAVTFIALIFVKCSYRLMMELLRPRSACHGWMRTFIGPRLTEEERKQDYMGLNPVVWVLRPYSSPGPLKYHILWPDLVLMFTVLFVYTVLSPISNALLLPAFAALNVAYRHQMIYIYDPSNDTGGQLWPQFASYFTVSMLIAQVTVLGVLSLNESAAAPLMIPLILLTVFFARYMRRQHPKSAMSMPLLLCHQTDTRHRRKCPEPAAEFRNTYKQKPLILPDLLHTPSAGDLEGGGEGQGERPTSEWLGRSWLQRGSIQRAGGGFNNSSQCSLGAGTVSTSGEQMSRGGSAERERMWSADGSVEAALGVVGSFGRTLPPSLLPTSSSPHGPASSSPLSPPSDEAPLASRSASSPQPGGRAGEEEQPEAQSRGASAHGESWGEREGGGGAVVDRSYRLKGQRVVGPQGSGGSRGAARLVQGSNAPAADPARARPAPSPALPPPRCPLLTLRLCLPAPAGGAEQGWESEAEGGRREGGRGRGQAAGGGQEWGRGRSLSVEVSTGNVMVQYPTNGHYAALHPPPSLIDPAPPP